MFHVGGVGICSGMLYRGGSVATIKTFSTNTFWKMVRDTHTTVVFLLGVMAQFLAKLPPTPDDADNPLRIVFMAPLVNDVEAFSKRFGVYVYTLFNMTETSNPIVSGPNPSKRGTCGRSRAGVEVRLVDENDCEVPIGEVGELIIRTDRPWAMNNGYFKNPEATAKAWRNGWFHTGDVLRKDADGDFFFVDRLKDTIRRRGENISSLEVEIEVTAHPNVREAAAVAVPSEHGEDEVMVVVAPVPEHEIDPRQLIEFLQDRLPHFMIPRYIRVLPELPKTPTTKVQKNLLREAGVTSDTWDREAVGIKIKRDRLK
jgi:crotonobetaine/carnitine-CoA ligase